MTHSNANRPDDPPYTHTPTKNHSCQPPFIIFIISGGGGARDGDAALAGVPEGEAHLHQPHRLHLRLDARPPAPVSRLCLGGWLCVCDCLCRGPPVVSRVRRLSTRASYTHTFPHKTLYTHCSAKLDNNVELTKFTQDLEAAVIKTVENGFMTKDLAICVHGWRSVHKGSIDARGVPCVCLDSYIWLPVVIGL